MLKYIATNWIEITGTILSLIYLYLSIKQNVSLWIFGFFCSALYLIVFFQSKFYAEMSLQFYYLAVSVYGWISWKTRKQSTGIELTIKRISKKQLIIVTIVSILIFLLYYFILANYTDSPLPKADSFTTALSIVATWMLARKILEHWLFWIVIDSISAGLYFYKALYPTALLFSIYTIMAVIGYYQWVKTLKVNSL